MQTYNESYAQYEAGAAALAENSEAYEAGKSQLESSEGAYNAAKNFTDAYESSGLNLIITGAVSDALKDNVISPYEQGREQLAQYEQGVTQLGEAQTALADGKAALDSAGYQLAAGASSLAAGEEEIAGYEASMGDQEATIASLSAAVAEYETIGDEADALSSSLKSDEDVRAYVDSGYSVAAAARLATADDESAAHSALLWQIIRSAVLACAGLAAAIMSVALLRRAKPEVAHAAFSGGSYVK